MPKSACTRTLPKSSSTAFVIRVAKSSDFTQLVELENHTFACDRLSERQWARHLASDSAAVLVAHAGTRLLGAALLFFRRGSDLARLYSLATDQGARGLGIGRSLLEACEHAAIARSCRRMRLEVRKDNRPAQQLYLAHGYVLIGQRRAYYEDGEDALCFEKTLAAR